MEGSWRAGGHTFPHLVRCLSTAQGGGQQALTRLGQAGPGVSQAHLPSQVKAHRDIGVVPTRLPCLYLLVPLGRHVKQASLCGSSHLLNHGLFFPQDITCYFRVGFQKVLNDLAGKWFCIEGKNWRPRVSISTLTFCRRPRGANSKHQPGDGQGLCLSAAFAHFFHTVFHGNITAVDSLVGRGRGGMGQEDLLPHPTNPLGVKRSEARATCSL